MKLYLINLPTSCSSKLQQQMLQNVVDVLQFAKQVGHVTTLTKPVKIVHILNDLADAQVQLDWHHHQEQHMALIQDQDYSMVVDVLMNVNGVKIAPKVQHAGKDCNILLQIGNV